MPIRSCLLLPVLLCAATVAAQKDRSSASSSHSSSHRVVVRDGKKVVDEKTVDGVPVDGRADPAPAPKLPLDPQDLLDRVRRGLPIDVGLPMGDGARASSSHTRRVVVENGVVVVDEETRDGVAIPHPVGRPAPGGASAEAHAESHGTSRSQGDGKPALPAPADRALPPPVDFTPLSVPPAKPRARRAV